MRTLGSVSAVIAAIREEAAAEVERLARESALPGLTSAGSQPEPAVIENEPLVMAARRRTADEELESNWNAELEDLQDRDRWMAAVVEEGRRILADVRDPHAVRTWLRALVEEAAAHLPPGACSVTVPAAAAEWCDASWLRSIASAVGRPLSIESAPIEAGCIVGLCDRPIAYDNSLAARHRRTEVAWRAALARVYAEAIAERGDPSQPAAVSQPAALARP